MKSGKIWGTTEKILSNDAFEWHKIDIVKGGYCSEHFHEYKYNAFYVESGKLKISIFKDNVKIDNDLIDETILKAGDRMTVEPNQFHMFEALEDTVAYETYWATLRHDDIIRRTVGGIKK